MKLVFLHGSPAVDRYFRLLAGNRGAVDGRVPQLHPAYDVLQELGGLHVGRSELGGIECARSDLEFCFCEADQDVLSTWSDLLRSRLIEVAEVHNRHGWLIVDEAGRCFGASQIHDAFYFEGHTFGEAVERLLLGRRAGPMLRPDQHPSRPVRRDIRSRTSGDL
jgi:hypothetical protein